jgi:fatty acyl-CoA reductase
MALAPPESGAHSAAAPTLEKSLYSITDHFDGACNVLITGASGYIGSLVLEKLLRSTSVGHVYLLLRPRRGAAPADRVRKLLEGPLFHLLEEKDAARVTAVAGDILQPGLGLSPEDEAMLVDKIDTVIHSAAGACAGAVQQRLGAAQVVQEQQARTRTA